MTTPLTIEGLPPLHAEALVEQRSIHTFDKAVGARTPDPGIAVLDILDGEQQLVGMGLWLAAEFPAIAGEDDLYRDAEGVLEGQYALAEQIVGGNRHLPSGSTWQRPVSRRYRPPPEHRPCRPPSRCPSRKYPG